MIIYDSMRIRDDLKQDGDNEFWVKEQDVLKLEKQLDLLKAALLVIDNDEYTELSDKAWEALCSAHEVLYA